MAADHGNGAGQQGIGSFNAKDLGEGDADAVLADGNDPGYQPVDDQQTAAFFQQGDAGTQAHGGEEGQHEGVLEVGVEFEPVGACLVTDEGDEHKEESPYHRGGDAVLPEGRAFPFDPVPQQQHHSGQCGGKDRISLESQDIFQHNDGHGTSLPFWIKMQESYRYPYCTKKRMFLKQVKVFCGINKRKCNESNKKQEKKLKRGIIYLNIPTLEITYRNYCLIH